MINKTLVIIMALLCAVCVVPVMAFSGAGSGTALDPYRITTRAQWNEMDGVGTCAYPPTYFKLSNDLDWTGETYTMINTFNGMLDGNGHSISNIQISDSLSNKIGVFKATCSGGYVNIVNLHLKNVDVYSARDVYIILGGGQDLYMGILAGKVSGNSYGSSSIGYNIFIDNTSSLIWDGVSSSNGEAYIGTIYGDGTGLSSLEQSISLANVVISKDNHSSNSVQIGGIAGRAAPAQIDHIIYAGQMSITNVSLRNLPTGTVSPLFGSYVSAYKPANYYDSTLNPWYTTGWFYNLSTTDMKDYTKYTTMSVDAWAEAVFNPDQYNTGFFTIGDNLFSDYYPIPYSFYPYNRLLSGFGSAPSSGNIPLTVTFTDASFFDPHPPRPDGTAYTDRNRVDFSPITYFWDFGDGTNSTLQNPPAKTYTLIGDYIVTFTVTNDHYSSTSSGHILAGIAPTPTPTITPTPTPTGTGTPTPTPTPVPAILSPSKVWWSNPNSSTHITSAYYGDIVRYNFDTVVAENNPGSVNRSDYFFLKLWKQNIQTGVWILAAYPYSYPAFNAQVNGTTSNHYIPPQTALPFGGVAWSGWYDISTIDNNKIELVGVNYSYPLYPQYIYGTAIITRSQNPLLVSNLGTWAQAVGGNGLRYGIALLFILILTCLPYLLLKQFNMYIEIIMFALAVGISYYAGLLDAWTLVVIPLGVLAVYILMRNEGGA